MTYKCCVCDNLFEATLPRIIDGTDNRAIQKCIDCHIKWMRRVLIEQGITLKLYNKDGSLSSISTLEEYIDVIKTRYHYTKREIFRRCMAVIL